jgi:hypothetical protein
MGDNKAWLDASYIPAYIKGLGRSPLIIEPTRLNNPVLVANNMKPAQLLLLFILTTISSASATLVQRAECVQGCQGEL